LSNISFEAIHSDPIQWREPQRYEPRRFDTSDPNNEWLLTSEGKPRNPLAFTPFMGGKRVCLGKTFAEVTTRFTVPLLYHFFDFEFVNREVQSAKKEPYGVAGDKDISLPMKLTIRNKA
jgi:cytochrome P450